MVKIFGTGLTGTIGIHLAKHGVEPLNFRNLDSVREQLTKARQEFSVIHLAGVVGSAIGKLDESEIFEVNAHRTRRLFELSMECGGLRTFVFASSSHVYARSNASLTEESELGPASTYAMSKLLAEELLQTHPNSNKLTIARIFSVLGLIGDRPGTLGHTALEVLSGERVGPIGWGLDVRDFSSPAEIGYYLVRLAARDPVGVVNLASGESQTVHAAITSLATTLGLQVQKGAFKMEHSSDPVRLANVEKLNSFFLDPR